MNAGQLIEETFLEIDQYFEKALDGLTPQELAWRPSPEANSIGFTYWHTARAEDVWLHDFALKQPHVFEREGWHQRWGIPAKDTGFGYTAEQVAQFPIPPLAEIRDYYREVRQETLNYLHPLTPEEFSFQPETDVPRRRGYTIGRMFGHLLCEDSQHLGHVAYIRGLIRGINK